MRKLLIVGAAAAGLLVAFPALAGPGGCLGGHKADQTADAPQTPKPTAGQSTPTPSDS